jgi:hypothetical protein
MRHSLLAFLSAAALALTPPTLFAQAAPAPPQAASPAAPDAMGPPRLPPFAGTVVSFDRRGDRVVACVDRSTVPTRPPAPGAPAPTPPKAPPAYRIWLIEREVMQELMTTGGLCGPAWSPDGKSFLASGARGLFAFTEPQYEARVLKLVDPPPPPAQPVAPAPAPPPAGSAAPTATVKTTEAAPIPFSQTAWSPGGRRVAFLLTADGASRVHVVDAKTGASVFSRDQPAKLVVWGPDDRTLVIDGVRVSLPS